MTEAKGLALVTGGSRGIGRGIVERLARDGFTVMFTYASRSDTAVEVVRAVEAAGGRAMAVKSELGEVAALERLFADVDATGLPLAVVVNNAATFDFDNIDDVEEARFDRTIEVNLKGPLFLAKFAAQRMGQGGRLIFISSLAAYKAGPIYLTYSLSKAGISSLVRGAAAHLGARGITVNALAPGLTDTEMTGQLHEFGGQAALDMAIASTALGRIGKPSDIANAVSIIASPDSGWITGQVIDCSGGVQL